MKLYRYVMVKVITVKNKIKKGVGREKRKKQG